MIPGGFYKVTGSLGLSDWTFHLEDLLKKSKGAYWLHKNFLI